MSDDFDEFFEIVGNDVPIYRRCDECDELRIVDPDNFNKPKCECDPGYCPYSVPICLCEDEVVLYSLEKIEECTFPNCECGNGKEKQTG